MNPSPSYINRLYPDEVFVFGANEAGIHGAGAALTALEWGAEMGKFGRMGQTYGIPSKDREIETLPLDAISAHVAEFIAHAKGEPRTAFLVTEIGCGLAGLKPGQIAPMFKDSPANVRLPQSFIDLL